jgi:hypothetical protein
MPSGPDGPAFPHVGCNTSGGLNVVAEGLTKREWFAGMALVGMLASDSSFSHESIADECFRYADAMLAESGGEQ